MIDRRNLLLSGTGVAALALTELSPLHAAVAPTSASGSASLNALFDEFMQENLDRSPIFATSLGLDTGARAHQRGEVDDNSLRGIAGDKKLRADQLRRLRSFDRNSVEGTDRLNYDVVLFGLQNNVDADERYDFGGGGAGSPYVISQLSGSYSQFPDFLDSQQPVENRFDVDAYMSRLSDVAKLLDNDSEVARHDAGLGVVPPDFALDKALAQLKTLRAVDADKSVMAQSVARRAKEKNIGGDFGAQAAKTVSASVYPALDRQIALVEDLRGRASHDAGVWKLPNGRQYYADSVLFWTTSTMSPDEIHATGLKVVADYTARIDAEMNKIGLKGGTVGQRLRKMYEDPKYQYPNTDAGKEQLLADLNKRVQVIRARLPQYFGTLPKADLIIKRVPKATEAGATGGYYNNGSLDGKRPGMYYINVRNTAEVPKWTLGTLTYHEGIGYMHDAMFRGARLVVDSGLHTMKWSRERAVKYYTDTLGDPEASAVTEVERYCVWPGQACGYMLGKLEILKLRQKAKTALGPKFDIREFHDAVLLGGAVPLAILDRVVDNYITKKRTA